MSRGVDPTRGGSLVQRRSTWSRGWQRSEQRTSARTREPLLGWLARNVFRLAIYLLAASLAAALYSVAADDTGLLAVPGLTVYFAFVGGFLGIPGAIGWLLIVASLPPEWSALRRTRPLPSRSAR